MKKGISEKYNAVVADRKANKAQIYYCYEVSKMKFASAIARFIQKYEDKSNTSILNKNAKFVLDNSGRGKRMTTRQKLDRCRGR